MAESKKVEGPVKPVTSYLIVSEEQRDGTVVQYVQEFDSWNYAEKEMYSRSNDNQSPDFEGMKLYKVKRLVPKVEWKPEGE